MRYLESKGYEVIGCVRKKRTGGESNYIECDLSKEVPNVEADIVIHMAARNPKDNNTFNDYFKDNIVVTENIIKYSRQHAVKKIISAGSVSSFGNVKDILTEVSPRNDLNDYGLTKYVSERLIANSGIPSRILVFPGVIGEGCNGNWLINTAYRLKENQDVVYYNPDGYFNSIIDIEDICWFIEKLIEKCFIDTDTYLLCACDGMMTKEVIQLLKEGLNSKSTINCVENKKGFYIDGENGNQAGFRSKSLKEIIEKICKIVNETY
jgi:nucleoside-diphosphate-sugar epimerase